MVCPNWVKHKMNTLKMIVIATDSTVFVVQVLLYLHFYFWSLVCTFLQLAPLWTQHILHNLGSYDLQICRYWQGHPGRRGLGCIISGVSAVDVLVTRSPCQQLVLMSYWQVYSVSSGSKGLTVFWLCTQQYMPINKYNHTGHMGIYVHLDAGRHAVTAFY